MKQPFENTYYMQVQNQWIYDRVSLDRKAFIPASIGLFSDPVGKQMRGRPDRTMADTNMYSARRFDAPNAMAIQRIFTVSVGQGEHGGQCPDDFRNSWLELVVANKIYARLPLPLIWSHRAATIAQLVEGKSIPANAYTPIMTDGEGSIMVQSQEYFYAEIRSARERVASKAHDFYIVLEGPFARSVQ